MLRLAIFLSALFLPFWCTAQQSAVFGALEGTVTDSTHLPVANAWVELLNQATGDRHRAVTDVNGSFYGLGAPDRYLRGPGKRSGIRQLYPYGNRSGRGTDRPTSGDTDTSAAPIAGHRNVGSLAPRCQADQCHVDHRSRANRGITRAHAQCAGFCATRAWGFSNPGRIEFAFSNRSCEQRFFVRRFARAQQQHIHRWSGQQRRVLRVQAALNCRQKS